MERIITTDEKYIWDLIEKARQGNTVIMIGLGNSMKPFLKNLRDYIYLIAVDKDTVLKKNDVVFYQSNDGNYVLHRIFSISQDGFYLNGDWNLTLEPLLKKEKIYLKAIGFLRKGKYISIASISYQSYVLLWTTLFRIRPFLLRWFGRFKKLTLVMKKGDKTDENERRSDS